MENIEIYERYFQQKYDVIREIINYFIQEEKKIAIWGAGLRGRAFLNVFDPNCEKVMYVFDKDEKKHGTVLDTGHQIVDFQEHSVDIIIVVNSKLEYKILGTLKDAKKSAQVLNIDNIVLGNLSVNDILFPRELKVSAVRDEKIAAIVILYNPTSDIIKNIKSYSGDLDKLYVHDNSIKKNLDIEHEIYELPNAEYYFADGNQGLCIPINRYYKKAIDEGMDWFITFDQDSIAGKGMISEMKKFANSELCDGKIGIIAPTINDSNGENIQQDIYYTYADRVIQSGAMHRLDMMKRVGEYDENLFIDEVDFEYCVRCRSKGYSIIKLNHAVLMHDCRDTDIEQKFVDGKMVYVNKYSPLRYYYRYRNALYCYEKYHEADVIYGLECKNTIKKVELALKYDDDLENKKKMLERAKYDFEHHIMGKYREENERKG
ncbi:MAG: hypothetical protein NC347_01965 [Clostridium sp.]|nr:hypothetical protein [Clostridium sp.]